jgi:50S ribosomal subunit-associated GTPase HflX
MRALTRSDVLVEDKLFATLSTTSRVLRDPEDEKKGLLEKQDLFSVFTF